MALTVYTPWSVLRRLPFTEDDDRRLADNLYAGAPHNYSRPILDGESICHWIGHAYYPRHPSPPLPNLNNPLVMHKRLVWAVGLLILALGIIHCLKGK
jgi:hypothetical protein